MKSVYHSKFCARRRMRRQSPLRRLGTVGQTWCIPAKQMAGLRARQCMGGRWRPGVCVPLWGNAERAEACSSHPIFWETWLTAIMPTTMRPRICPVYCAGTTHEADALLSHLLKAYLIPVESTDRGDSQQGFSELTQTRHSSDVMLQLGSNRQSSPGGHGQDLCHRLCTDVWGAVPSSF